MRIYIYTYSLCGRRVKQLTQFQQRLCRIASDVQNTLDPPNASSVCFAPCHQCQDTLIHTICTHSHASFMAYSARPAHAIVPSKIAIHRRLHEPGSRAPVTRDLAAM